MRIAPRHLTPGELEQGLTDVLASPRDVGRLEFIVVRPAPDEHRSLTAVRLHSKAESTVTAGPVNIRRERTMAGPTRGIRSR